MNANKKLMKSAAAFGAASVLLFTFVISTYPQARPSTLTPSVDGAAPGESFRVDMNPVIGMRGQEAENLRIVLRPSRAQGAQSDLELRIEEFYGSGFRVRMPQEARPNMGPGRLHLLNQRGDVLASSKNANFRILAAPRAGQVAPGSGSAGAGPAPDRAGRSAGPDPRQGREERPSRQGGMTAPGVSAQAEDPQVFTTPGISAQAQRLPTPVTDYVGIATREIVLKSSEKTDISVFTLPSDVRLDDQVVLMFMANPDDAQIEFEVTINGHEIRRVTFKEGAVRTFHIRFNARGILRSGRNELGLLGYESRVGGIDLGRTERKIRVDDIVLLFHRDIHW
jgi:hypothetical protein